MKVKCLVRVAPGSAIYEDDFDIQTQELSKYNDLVKVRFDINKFKGGGFFPESCIGNLIPWSEYYDAMNRRPKACLVINYNNVGFIVCGPNDWEIYLRESQKFINSYEYDILLTHKVQLAGLLKVPLYSASTMQALSKLYILTESGKNMALLADGIHEVRGQLDIGEEVVQRCKPKYVNMCLNSEAVGLISVGGQVIELLKSDLD